MVYLCIYFANCCERLLRKMSLCLIFVYFVSAVSSANHGVKREHPTLEPLPNHWEAATGLASLDHRPAITKQPVPAQHGIVLNYTLELDNSSPAVLDSAITFLAKLRDYNGHLVNANLFQFVWEDSASPHHSRITRNNLASNITKVYRSGEMKAGTYNMKVTLFKSSGQQVASDVMDYNVTDLLNGNLIIRQTLEYQRERSVLSTKQPLRLNASVTDRFRPGMAQFKYMWYHNTTLISTTNSPQLNLSLAFSGPHEISVVVLVRVAMDVFTLPKYVTLSGRFVQRFLLKDPLRDVRISGGAAVPINKLFHLNITCNGSVPTSLCWNVTTRSNSYPGNTTCSPSIFLPSCQHIVNLSLSKAGKYRFSTMIVNDVSLVEKRWILRAYDPDNVNIPAITIPVVFACLACIVVLLGVAYIMKLRKKPYVEVADFDFHPSLTKEVEDSKLSVRIRKTMKSLLSHPGVKTKPRRVESTFNHYGSLDDDAIL